MPVFFLTIHAYRSWRPDDPRGFVRRGEGVLAADEGLALAYAKNASESPAHFESAEQRVVLRIVRDACRRRRWRLHGFASEPSHVHLLVSWTDNQRSSAVCAKLKNLISRELNVGRAPRRKWLSRGASRRPVRDQQHFDYLITHYLPKHRGLVWLESEGGLGP